MNLSNLKIRHRLGIGFATVLIITGIIGFIGENNVDKLWSSTENLYKHPLAVSKSVRDIRTNIVAMHRSIKDVALADNDVQIDQAELKMNEYERQVYKSFEIVFDRFLGEISDVQVAYDAFVNWKPILEEVIRLRHAGKRDEAAAITKGKCADHVENMNAKIQTMIDFANQKGDSFYAEAKAVKEGTINKSFKLLASAVLIVIIVSVLVTRSISKPLASILAVSGRLKEGDLSARNTITTTDEMGFLAKSMNDLAESIESRIAIQNSVMNISTTMIGLSSMQEFGSVLLKQLVDITKSNMGTFYILDETTDKFVHFASIGANEELLKSFKSENSEGEFGNALLNKRIYYLKDIPESTILKFQTTAGDAIPKEIITIPIIVEDTVVALISLVNIHKFEKECYNILEQSWLSINVYYSGLIADERTRILAEYLSNTNLQLEAQSEKLQKQSEELQSSNEELQQQTEELEESNIELESQKKLVEDANRLKSEFLSNMSHELRTPLNSILALSRVVIDQSQGKLSNKQVHYLEIVERNGKQLLQLINDILDLSRIEAGFIDLNPKSFSIRGIIEVILENLSPLAKDKGLELKVEVPDDLPELESDETKVHQILINIIGNAVKFTEKGTVNVSVKCDAEQMLITTKDTGIGIAADKLSSIFQEFHQIDASSSRSYEGTGLGLAIVSKSARMLGGDITVESELGKGSSFTLTLPIKWPEPLPTTESVPVAVPDSQGPVSIVPSGQRILLVDDQEAVIIQISSILESVGYKIDVAQGGREALDYLQHTIPDGIVLDLMMPGVDGFEVLVKIRNQEATAKIPVLVLTAKDLTPDDLNMLKSNKIQQLIQKGDVDKKQLLSKIQIMFENEPAATREKTEQTANDSQVGDVKKDRIRPPVKRARTGTPAVLIVEDNLDNLTSIKAILQEKYKILEARDGEQGLRATLENLPDLVILDMMLPKMDGFEMVKRIKADKKASNIPIIALTAMAMKGDRERILAAGCNDYLAKPVDRESILGKLEEWLGK